MWVISASGGAVINTEQTAFIENDRQGTAHYVTAHMAYKTVVLLATDDMGAASRALSAVFAGIAARRRVLDLRILVQTDGAGQHGEGEEPDHVDRE